MSDRSAVEMLDSIKENTGFSLARLARTLDTSTSALIVWPRVSGKTRLLKDIQELYELVEQYKKDTPEETAEALLTTQEDGYSPWLRFKAEHYNRWQEINGSAFTVLELLGVSTEEEA